MAGSPPEPLRRRVRGAAFRLALPLLSGLLGLLPWSAVRALGRRIGLLLYRMNGRERRRMADHLAMAFPDLSAAERSRLARRCAALQGANLAENLRILARGMEGIVPRVAVEGWEHVEAARAAGRPLLFLTAHCGNWELIGAALTPRGIPLYGFGRELHHSALQDALVRLRERLGAGTLVRGAPGSARGLRRVVRGEAGLVMLIDQDTEVDGVWVPFFGRPAYTPTAAAALGARHGMAVIPSFLSRRADGDHLCRFHPPLEMTGDPTRDTAALTALTERHIREHPAQWVWMHRRWRRQPPADGTPAPPS